MWLMYVIKVVYLDISGENKENLESLDRVVILYTHVLKLKHRIGL